MSAPTLADQVPVPRRSWRKHLRGWNLLGMGLLLGALLASFWRVTRVEEQQYAADVDVVRIAHWQLELGFREALQAIIDDYNALQRARFERHEIPRRAVVVQVPVSEKIYAQLINTHLIAGTAPDIIEMGKASMSSGAYRAQYFLNLSPEIEKPNPYNAAPFQAQDLSPALAASLPTLGWRETFLDGLAGGFDAQLQAYYAIPTTFTPWNRYAVNLDLLREATGSDEPPKTLGAFLAACEKLRQWGRGQGREIWPIAGSSYSASFYGNYAVPFLAASQARLDADRDGSVTMFEALAGLKLERWSFRDRSFSDFLDAVSAVSANFPNGFLGMDREGAMLLFTQGQAGFLYVGAWDAGTVYRLTEGKFRVAIVSNVLPGPGEKWGPLAGVNEASMTSGGAFGIDKASAHLGLALDFLRFWTSQAQNQRFNNTADWVPCIVGSKVRARMSAFVPEIDGYASNAAWLFPWNEGGQLSSAFEGKMQAVLAGQSSKADVVASMTHMAADANYGVDAVLAQGVDDARVSERNAERGIAAQAVAQLLAPELAAPSANYVAMVAAQAQQLNGHGPEASMRCLKEQAP